MTRRGSIDALAARLTGLYDAREARSIALAAVAELSGLSPSALLTDPEAELAVEGLEEAAARLAAGEPLQYVVGHTEFYGRRFAVREGVLIPRPETEELVDAILHGEREARRLLDVGTGSGCIAASLALGMPGTEVFAADISDDALTVAAENFQQLGAAVTLRKADALNGLEEAFPERFDAIVSNPPYVPESDRAAMHPNVRDHEPGLALFVPDDDAIRFYRAIARAGRQMLTSLVRDLRTRRGGDRPHARRRRIHRHRGPRGPLRKTAHGMHPAEIRKKRDKTPDEALAALMRLCARAEKSEGDARRLMRGWGVAEKDAEQVLGRLVRDRFIDDSRYAEAFVREKLRLSGWGEYKIRTALQRKGVSKERIDAALSQADRPAMGERLAQQLERKARTVKYTSQYELKTKLIRYGLSLGYDYEAVMDAASAMVRETDTCNDF